MITVTYRPDTYEVKVKGNGEGKKETAILFYTLANSLLKAPKTWFKKEPEMADSLSSKTGVSFVKCRPNKDFATYITLMYESILTGVELLADIYPDNITLKILKH